jgi:hypothetical protein
LRGRENCGRNETKGGAKSRATIATIGDYPNWFRFRGAMVARADIVRLGNRRRASGMGKSRYAIVPLISIFAALSFAALAQQPPGPQGRTPQKAAPQKAVPQRAAPVQRGPVTGARSGPGPQGARTGVQQGGRAPQQGYRGPGPGAGGRVYHAERRDWGGLAWDRGRWRHEWRNGRYGWWWDTGGAWYYYDQPTDGPPTMVSDVEVMDDPNAAAEGPPPDEAPPPGAYPPPAVVYPPPPAVYVPPPPVVCVGPLCIR